MKKIFSVIVVLAMTLSSCKTVYDSRGGHLPPGQAKKITGSKSAKSHAPGQVKKKA